MIHNMQCIMFCGLFSMLEILSFQNMQKNSISFFNIYMINICSYILDLLTNSMAIDI